jgi:hypothetical protein
MRRILLICAGGAVLTLPAAAAAGARGHSTPGFLVVRKAAGDGGIYGNPVVTVVVQGFVLGRISPRAEARVDVYQLPSAAGGGAPQAAGPDVTKRGVRWRSFPGNEFSGSGFRFRATGGTYRVVVRGSGVYLFAGGEGNVTLRGSSVYPGADGTYSVDGRTPRSLPANPLKRKLGRS